MPRNHPQITICTVYHPPGADDWTLLNHIDQSVDYVRRHHPYTGVIIMGDLNKLRDSHLKRNHNLKQIVDIPTRGTATLDKIYTNLTDLYHRPVVIASIGLSDHMVVVCTPSTTTKYTEPFQRRLRAVAGLMIEPVLQQRSTASRGKPYSTYQAVNNNCSFSILQSELYSTRISLNEKSDDVPATDLG